MPRLIPDFRREVENAEAAVADKIKLVGENFRELGVSTDSFPAGESNIIAAQIQFENRLKETPEVLAAIGRHNRSKSALAGIIGQTKSVPRHAGCRIDWRPAVDESQRKIALLAEVL